MGEQAVTTVTSTWSQTVLGAVAALALLAIIFLFRYYNKKIDKRDEADAQRDKDLTAERAAVTAERAQRQGERQAELAQLREEYERKHRALIEQYADRIVQIQHEARAHEDEARKEFAEMMEGIERESAKSSQALVEMLNKFYDRFVGPRARY